MNIFKKHQKAMLCALMILSALFAMVIPTFAEGEAAEASGWNDPMLYVFFGFVAGFFTLFIGAIVIYFKVKKHKKIKEWEDDDGSVKLYEDLDDAKWDAPDSVFLDALEPTAAILMDPQPVPKIHGLDGIIISETNPNPMQSINSGAIPYAYKIDQPLTNQVYEDVPYTTLEDNRLVIESKTPINASVIPKASPVNNIIDKPEYNDVPHGYVGSQNYIFEHGVQRSTLVDAPATAPEMPKREEPILPKANPLSGYVTKDVPITIVTSKDVGGVVHISASIYENTVTPTVLVDEKKPDAPVQPEPIMASVTPQADPATYLFQNKEEPVFIPTAEAAIYESITASLLEDEPTPVKEEPVVIPETVIPKADPITTTFVTEETPVVVPVAEAAISEEVAESKLVDEPTPAPVAEPVVVAEAILPREEFVFDQEIPEEEIVIPTEQAAVYEDVASTVLEDEAKPAEITAEEATVISDVILPKEEFLFDQEIPEEEIVIPTEQAAVYEEVATTVLVDEPTPAPVEPVATVLHIDEAVLPSQEFLFDSEIPESRIELPETGAVIYEDTVETTVLVDEPTPAPVEPVATVLHIDEAVLPSQEFLFDNEIPESRIELPETGAVIYENTVETTVLVDESTPAPIEPVATVLHIDEAVLPSQEFLFDNEIPESRIELPETGGVIYEDTVEVTELVDEPIPEAIETYEEPVDIEPANLPKSTFINNTVFTEEKIVRKTGKNGHVTEEVQHTELHDAPAKTAEHHDAPAKAAEESDVEVTVTETTKKTTYRTVFEVIEEEIAEEKIVEEKTEVKEEPKEEPVEELKEETREIFEEKSEEKSEQLEETTEEPAEQPAEEETVTETHAIIDTDEGVIEVVEERHEAPVEEPHVDVVPKRASKIDTIPTTRDGRVQHTEPMIPTIPTIRSKNKDYGESPFVLPATATGMGMMQKNPAYKQEESEPSFENALNAANELPIAPIIDRPVEQPAPAPAAERPDVVMADAEVNITFADEEEAPAIPETLPELINEPELAEEPEVEEPVVEEPAVEEPVAEPEIEEPVEEPEIEEPVAEVIEEPAPEVEPEPEVVPVFADAETADELMSDEEAALSVELIDETPGKTRSGKVHAINLDTICDHFNDGDVVTLDALKQMRLAPQNAGRLKVLARGTMNKKLTIESDSFSLQAVKMITLAGGHAEQYK